MGMKSQACNDVQVAPGEEKNLNDKCQRKSSSFLIPRDEFLNESSSLFIAKCYQNPRGKMEVKYKQHK
jgi:hypothetical protein